MDEGFCFIVVLQTYKSWHRPTLPRFTAVPSALAGLTSLFGMGRGGHRRYRHLNVFNAVCGKQQVSGYKYAAFRLWTFHFELLTYTSTMTYY